MRHSWQETLRVAAKTERVCRHCGIVKVTRHEPAEYPPHWIEFWRPRAGDLPERLPDDRTPECVAGVGRVSRGSGVTRRPGEDDGLRSANPPYGDGAA